MPRAWARSGSCGYLLGDVGKAIGNELHQFWGGSEVPVGGLRVDMPQVGGEQGQLGLHVVALLVPPDQCAYRKSVTKIMGPWSTCGRPMSHPSVTAESPECPVELDIVDWVAERGYEEGTCGSDRVQ